MVKINTYLVGDEIPSIDSYLPTGGLEGLARRVAEHIVQRTLAGRDAANRPFKAYSTKGPIYVSIFAKPSPRGGKLSRTGKSRRYDGGYNQYKGGRVNLKRTGKMLSALRVIPRGAHHVTISCPIPYAAAVNKQREFMAISPKDVRALWSE